LIKLQLLLTKIAKQMIPKLPWRTSQCIAGIYQYYVHIWDVQQGVRLWPTIIWSQTCLYWLDIEEHRLGKNPASTLQDQGVNKSRSMGATRTNLIDQ
jgi:hypothetical protein